MRAVPDLPLFWKSESMNFSKKELFSSSASMRNENAEALLQERVNKNVPSKIARKKDKDFIVWN